MRIEIFRILPIVLFSAAIFSPLSAQEKSDTLSIASWGGPYKDSQIKAYGDPYEELNPDVDIIWTDRSPDVVATLQAMKEDGTVTWDLVDVTADEAIRLCDEGLAIKFDPEVLLADGADGTPAKEDFGAFLISDCFIPKIVFSTTFGYRSDMIPAGTKPPTNICDIFDLKTYPGKRSLQKSPINNLEWALICDGVDKEDVYDVLETAEGQERALAKLESIKESTIWWSAGADTPELLSEGKIFMGSADNNRLFSIIEEKDQPVNMMWDAQVFNLDGWIIPAGLPQDRLARAKDFVKFATETQRLADQAAYVPYGPARKSSTPLVGKHSNLGIDMSQYIPTEPSNMTNTVIYNYDFWADYQGEIDTKFQDWIEKTEFEEKGSSSYKAKVNVLFGTTRKRDDSRPSTELFNSYKYDKIEYGFVQVLVPETHLIGDTSNGSKTIFERLKEAVLGEDNADEFALSDLKILTQEEFRSHLAENNDNRQNAGFIYVHGFATSFEFAAQRTAQIAFDLQPYIAAPMFFSWPSRGVRSRRAYQADENMIELNRLDLAEFIKQAVTTKNLKKVHVIAHSLGARLLSEALEELEKQDPELLGMVGEIVLAAPDVSSQSFEKNFLRHFMQDPARTTIYASDSDWALNISNAWHGNSKSSIRLGEIRDGMRVFEGIDTIDISGLDGSFDGHSVAQQNPAVLADLFWIYSKNIRPNERCCLEEKHLGEMRYWKMKGK